MPAAGSPPRGIGWGSLLLLVAAFAWFWPVLHHGLRSDDFLLAYYTDRPSGAVQWDRVFAEFGRPWFDGGELYRPLISLSYALELWLWPGAATAHTVNVLLVGLTAAAAAATASLLAPRRHGLAAALAGAVVLLHPAAVETAAWHAARVTNLQMACCAAAALCYTRHLVLQRPLWPALTCFALGLLSKEGATALPVTLLALDLLHGGARGAAPWRARCRRLAPFAVLLLAYFGLRLAVLGRLGPADHAVTVADLGNVAVRTAQLVLPPDGDGRATAWPLALLAGALLPLLAARRALLLLAPSWCFLVLAPTLSLAASFTVFYGRFVFDALPALGLVLGLAVAHAPRRWPALAATLAASGWLLALATTSRNWLDRYEREDRLGRATAAAVHAGAAAATPATPFAVTGLPYLPVFHQKLWGVLGLAPYAPRDLAVIGLPELLVPDEKAPQFRYDAAPVHAVLAAGGTVARFDHATTAFVPLPPPAAGSLELTATAAAPRDVLAATPWSGSAVAAVEVTLPGPARSISYEFLDDLPAPHTFATQTLAAASTTVWLPTSHALPPVLLQGVGVPFRGLRLTVDGGAPPAGTTVRVHATLPQRALPQRNAGAPRSRDALYALSTQPPFAGPARLYVMLPTGVRHVDVPAGGAPMPAVVREHLRWALDLYAPLTVHWFWQSPPDGATAPWRSELDWATAR